MPAMDGLNDLVGRLVTTHGEGGVCPTASDWHMILTHKGTLHLLNLLKFRPSVDTDDGPISGADAYDKYSSGVAQAFAEAGGRRIFRGRVQHMFCVRRRLRVGCRRGHALPLGGSTGTDVARSTLCCRSQ